MVSQLAILVAGARGTLNTLQEQLKRYLPKRVEMRAYALDEGVPDGLRGDVLIVSSQLAYEELMAQCDVTQVGKTIIAGRSIPFHRLEQLVGVPVGTQVLLVNDLQETAQATIEQLRGVGLSGPNYTAYAPGMPLADIRDFKIAVTPGESDRVPPSIERVIDIGPRVLDFPTIMAVVTSFNVSSARAGAYSRQYLQVIIELMASLSASRNEVAQLNMRLSSMLDRLGDGLLLVDGEGQVVFVNDVAKQVLDIQDRHVTGRPIGKLLRQRGLSHVLADVGGEGRVVELGGEKVAVTRTVMPEQMSMVSFKRVQESIDQSDRYRQELRRKGLVAKYSFGDILGQGKAIEKAKKIGGKLATSDLTILIEGESGTGKELFASAIHRQSPRNNAPFLAVNFSALPDNLIESELFGYVEGAFTGAKKGGKVGLFEQADGGTLFLDEIGDISHKVQARLLRVLQEGEFMPVGGSEVRTVDVRVVAATNRDLFKMVEMGDFRSDLYYRLKRGYIPLPPLRNRLEDIPKLAHRFLQESGVRDIAFTPKVIERFQTYHWHGNVRELRNTIEYMIAVRESNVLGLDDLPDHINGKGRPSVWRNRDVKLSDEEVFLLRTVRQYISEGEVCGREKLAALGVAQGFPCTPHTVRSRLQHMEELGLISKRKGRHGTRLTEWGNQWLDWHQKVTNGSPDI